MPYVVDSPDGAYIHGINAPVFHPTPTSLAATVVADLVALVPSAPAQAASAINMTEVVADQAAQQAGMDSTTPRNLFLAVGSLLLLCMLVSHPRFLARFFASFPSRSRALDRRNKLPQPHNMSGDKRPERVVGGGGLAEGWFLRKGEKQTGLPPSVSEKDDPFMSPFEDIVVPVAEPHLYPPPHIAPLLSHLPFSHILLFAPFSRLPNPFRSSATLVQLYLIIGYLILVILALVWKSDLTWATKDKGYGSDFARSGMVALAQIPLVVALGVRGNLVGLCVGKGYERLKVFHKMVGRTSFLCATLHAAFYMHKWAVAGKFSASISKPFIMHGLVAWIAIVVIAVSSLPWVRNACYGVFEICHFVGMITLLAGLCAHVDVAVPFCIAALLIYLVSLICSFTKTRLAHAELVALPGSRTTLVTIPTLRSGWRAGQHVRLRVPSLGFPHGLEAHPFTIASAPDGDGMVLMCKAAGNWTQRLYDHASSEAETSNTSESETGPEKITAATVILEGPYGGMGNTMLPSFSSVLLVAGGSGITHALTLAHDLISRSPNGVVRARTVDLIWAVRTEDVARALMPTLLDLVHDARSWEATCLDGRKKGENRPLPTALRIKIYVTRCPASSPLDLLTTSSSPFNRNDMDCKASEADQEKFGYLYRTESASSTLSIKHKYPLSAISVHSARPDIAGLLVDVADETVARHGREMTDADGICVTACGPSGLCDDVRSAVRGLEEWKSRAVGGVDLEVETFGF